MNLNLKITRDERAAMLRLKDVPKQMLQPLARAWDKASQEVLGHAVRGRFTGKGPFPVSQNKLGVVTNRLRKSLRAGRVQLDLSSGTIRSTMGSNVSYFAPHEFGFRGKVQVQGHSRRAVAQSARSVKGGLATKAENRHRKSSLKSGRGSSSFVRPHSRRVNIPARAPLGTQIEDIKTRLTFRQKIQTALRLILRKQS